mmetsp:Transcript_2145/g.4931  ORF Transcript_2145/g.4931 Transcript_2145/m.4931 type:complete len:246 (-) Transcript_2145:261-998(-)
MRPRHQMHQRKTAGRRPLNLCVRSKATHTVLTPWHFPQTILIALAPTTTLANSLSLRRKRKRKRTSLRSSLRNPDLTVLPPLRPRRLVTRMPRRSIHEPTLPTFRLSVLSHALMISPSTCGTPPKTRNPWNVFLDTNSLYPTSPSLLMDASSQALLLTVRSSFGAVVLASFFLLFMVTSATYTGYAGLLIVVFSAQLLRTPLSRCGALAILANLNKLSAATLMRSTLWTGARTENLLHLVEGIVC